MKQMIENLINGNLSDAKQQACKYGEFQIFHRLWYGFNWSHKRAKLAAHYLKTGEGYQDYCDAN